MSNLWKDVLKYKATEPEYFAIGPDGADANIVVDPSTTSQDVPPSGQAKSEQDPACRLTDVSSQERAGSGLKRSLVTDSDSESTRRASAALTALYSAEMFSANFAVKHVLNITVRDDVIWMWYYDRQGIISVGGINFAQDLPRYLALLYALQRFDWGDWGRNTDFKPHLTGNAIDYHTIVIDRKELKLDWDSRDRLTQFTLKERATNVIPVTCEQLDIERPNETKDGMVAKVYWGEEERASEPDILEHVARVVKENKDVEGHVPFLLLSHKFAGPTSIVRKALGLDDAAKDSRAGFILVFRKLRPIHELQKHEFFEAWRHCVLCKHRYVCPSSGSEIYGTLGHFGLWTAGVHHHDVSCINLMYYRIDGKVMGVLNDYDLASLPGSPSR
ncbi:hypothetical protein BU15DRAFT_77755 [Melanogaster broomeanus]|nr:hypothetical protein BU15DRAFT_77755 [Melanogaster broomeanus]